MFTHMSKRSLPQENIEYIQTCIRHKTGVGEAIDIDFRAPMDTSSYEASLKDINYNWRELGNEKEMLQNEMYREYAYL